MCRALLLSMLVRSIKTNDLLDQISLDSSETLNFHTPDLIYE